MYSIYKALSPAENHTLSLHDALPISNTRRSVVSSMHEMPPVRPVRMANPLETPGRLCTLRRACKRQTQSAVGTNDEGRQHFPRHPIIKLDRGISQVLAFWLVAPVGFKSVHRFADRRRIPQPPAVWIIMKEVEEGFMRPIFWTGVCWLALACGGT